MFRRWAIIRVVRPSEKSLQGGPDQVLAHRVEAGSGLVQDQDRRVFEESAGYREPLRFTTGEPQTPLPHLGLVALRQPPHELLATRERRRVFYFPLTCLRTGHPDVLQQAPVEQVRTLRHECNVLPPGTWTGISFIGTPFAVMVPSIRLQESARRG